MSYFYELILTATHHRGWLIGSTTVLLAIPLLFLSTRFVASRRPSAGTGVFSKCLAALFIGEVVVVGLATYTALEPPVRLAQGLFELSPPAHWQMTNAYPGASWQMFHRPYKQYMTVHAATPPTDSFDLEAQSRSHIKSWIEAQPAAQLIQTQPLRIHGLDAIEIYFVTHAYGTIFHNLHTLIQGQRGSYQVISWTWEKSPEDNLALFRKVTGTFVELP